MTQILYVPWHIMNQILMNCLLYARLINNVLRAAQGNTLAQTCPQLLYHYHKQSNPRHYPTYRDILFLSLIAGKDTIEACKYITCG